MTVETYGMVRGSTQTGPMGGSLAIASETASAAMAAMAKASVEARYTVALHRPRNALTAQQRVLAECKRPSFADASLYRLPRGGACKECAPDKYAKKGPGCPACFYGGENLISGLSIRFAEAAMAAMGNMESQTIPILDDEDKVIVLISVADLETNIGHSQPVLVRKVVERRATRDGNPPKGREPLGQRLNSYGDLVYIVRATEDEMRERTNAEVSRVLRTLILRLLPADMKERAQAVCEATLRDRDAADPKAAMQSVLDAFESLGILAASLERYLGHSLEPLREGDVGVLRALYGAIRDEHISWDEVEARFEAAAEDREAENEVRTKVRASAAEAAEKRRAAAKAKREEAAAEERSDEVEAEPTAEVKPKAQKGAGERTKPQSVPKAEAKAEPQKAREPETEPEDTWAEAAEYLDKRGFSLSQQASIRGRAEKLVGERGAKTLLDAAESIASEMRPAVAQESDDADGEGMPS